MQLVARRAALPRRTGGRIIEVFPRNQRTHGTVFEPVVADVVALLVEQRLDFAIFRAELAAVGAKNLRQGLGAFTEQEDEGGGVGHSTPASAAF